MITIKQIEVYMSYGGDGDGFVRFATREEKAIIDYEHWSLIDNFIQDIRLVKKGLVSEEYSKIIEERLSDNCDTERTVVELKRITDEV